MDETERFFGACPRCGHNDGYYNIRRANWFVCHKHRTKWLRGENLLSSWREETEVDWLKNKELLSRYDEVEPIYTWPPKRSTT